jgi:L-asparagine transporter-like permease
MAKQEARTQALLRERDARKRSMQIWIGAAVIWGVVLGWVAWGLIGMLFDDSDRIAWLTYLVPLAVLVIGALVAAARVRRTTSELVALAEEH